MKINILFEVRQTPWGGGNQFLKTLRKYLLKKSVYSEDIQGAEVVIFNSHHNLAAVLEAKYNFPDKVFIQRVDGPLNVVRGGSNRFNDFIIRLCNRRIADGTIFQSDWSRNGCHRAGFKNKYETVIINAPDKEIFNPQRKKEFNPAGKIKIVTTSWSQNLNKGFNILSYLDSRLDFSKYGITFIGSAPLDFKNIKVLGILEHARIPEILKSQDIFLFPSKLEACSNSLLEALHCGLPAVAYSGSSNAEIVKGAGELFCDKDEVTEKIERVAANYLDYQNRIALPLIEDVAQEYYEFCLAVFSDAQNKQYSVKSLSKKGYLMARSLLKIWRLYTYVAG